MTDTPNWQSPAGSAPPEQASPWASTPTSNPYATPVAAPVWAPPPKPGLIPLRPLSFGTIIGSSFRVMRRNPGPTFGLSVLLYGVIIIVYLAVVGAVVAYSISRVSSAAGTSDESAILSGAVGLFALSALVPIGLAVIASGILQGIIALEVSRATLGEKLRTRGLWRLAKGRLGALIGYTLLLTLIIVIFIVIAAGVTFLVFGGIGSAFVSNDNAVGAVLGAFGITFLFGAVFVVVGAWLGTKLSLVPSAIMLERLSMRHAVVRSWTLTRGHFWRTLGTQLLISVIINTASSVISVPISFIGGIAGSLINPNSDPVTTAIAFVAIYIAIGVVSIVVGAVGLVMQSAAYSLIYIDIRMRKEGLDLELMRYVESKQAGVPGVDNPYLPPAPDTLPTASPWA